MEPIALHDGRIMQVHEAGTCAGQFCCIHNPSDHALKSAPLSWRGDRRLMERICPHGVGHPDPDGLAADAALLGYDPYERGVHGCDGCCG